MNLVAKTIINPLKEYWPCQGLNQGPPVLKSATLPTELWFSERFENWRKKENAGLVFRQHFQKLPSSGLYGTELNGENVGKNGWKGKTDLQKRCGKTWLLVKYSDTTRKKLPLKQGPHHCWLV